MKKDNSTLNYKISLRRWAVERQPPAFVLETHGGVGRLYEACYSKCGGVVFEKDARKAEFLAVQRPTWAVYENDSAKAICAGALKSYDPFDLVDCDPYGQPWEVLQGVFRSGRLADDCAIVVNDGLRQKLRVKGGWAVESMAPIVAKYGNDRLFDHYLAICREMLEGLCVVSGHAVVEWRGYYCGYHDDMTHYAAILKRGTT